MTDKEELQEEKLEEVTGGSDQSKAADQIIRQGTEPAEATVREYRVLQH